MQRFSGACVELFSGGGGLAIGVERAGFRHEALVEWNPHARQTIALNKPKWPLLDQPDVRDVDFKQYRGAIALVAGGPPCQPFSLGGLHRGDLDSRNMFPEAVRAVREIQPEAFLFENVKGLARPNFAPYLDYIVHQLRHPWLTRKIDEDWADHFKRLQHIDKSGLTGDGPEYTVECSKISCADYGAPQLRQRVVFIGFRKDLDIEWTLPKATHSEAALLYDQYVSGEYWKRHGKSPQRVPIQHRAEVERMKILGQLDNKKPWATVRDSIHAFGAPARIKDRVSIEHDQHVLIPGARVYEGHSGSPLDWPGKTLKAGVHGVPGGENTVVLDNGEIRYFTVREAASLQGFPPDYSFAGIWGECMRQIGNAVPVMVAEFFASEIRKKLTASKRLALAAG